jgi:BirA family biotin operon repressor/biotin-[acetyl-CoA-carboxylase] ligase
MIGRDETAERLAGATIRLTAGWRLLECAEVTSTNLVAAPLVAWHAVRADTQTAGRGRFQRHWVSDAGGLWLSAVLPVAAGSAAERLLPLTTGLAIWEVLRALGGKGLRMRWPNDLLVGEAKLAGLLIDRFASDRAVVGIGINVFNQPQRADPALQGRVMRLADWVSAPPEVSVLADRVLAALRAGWLELDAHGPEAVLSRIQQLWALPRRVELDLDGEVVQGDFAGVDAAGRLGLQDAAGRQRFYEPQEVRLLRDLNTRA